MYFIFFILFMYVFGALGTIGFVRRSGESKIPRPPKHLDPNYKKRKR